MHLCLLLTNVYVALSLYRQVWDVAAAVEVGKKMVPLLEGKTPSINYGSLFQIFAAGSGIFSPPSSSSSPSSLSPSADSSELVPVPISTPRECPDSLKNFPLDPAIVKLVSDIVDASNRIVASVPLPATAPAPTGKKGSTVGPAPVTFTEVSLAIVLGQVLRLRDFVKEKYETVVNTTSDVDSATPDNANSSEPDKEIAVPPTTTTSVPSPFAAMTLVARSVKESLSFGSMDNACFALAVEWFVSGGTRESLLHEAMPVAQVSWLVSWLIDSLVN